MKLELKNSVYDLSPTLGAMENNRTAKFDSEAKLRFENLAHPRRNVLVLETVETDLPNPELRIRQQPPPQLFTHHSYIFTSLSIPRMYAEEMLADDELANRSIPAADMTMDIGHGLR